MSAETKYINREIGSLWALLVLPFWLLGMPPAQAQVRPAQDPIVGSRLQRIVAMIPGSATDLPPYLAKSQDVYLLVTAGASYTDIQVLANPEVSPQTVAHALSSALVGTPLRGQPVEWSADRYSAAQMTVHQARFGATHGSNIVPVGLLMSGLRQAGLTPHLLLRVPRFAQTSLPLPGYGTKSFRWYDAHHLGGQGSVTVAGALSPLSLVMVLSYFLIIPVIGSLGLSLAGFLSRRGRLEDAARRHLFRSVNGYAMMTALMAQVAGVFLLQTPVASALSDLWFGSSSVTPLVPFLPIAVVPLLFFFVAAHKQELRLFGPVSMPSAIPMSDEEKAVRKRVAKWSLMPHLIGAVALGVVPFFVSRTSPLYPYIHPLALFLPAVGAGLVARILQKRLDKFTQKTLDDDLTWRARQLGQTLGVRMPDVFVEDSSRAAHLAFASHSGHHITLSRKLLATFTPAETDFVLAHHLACMKRRGSLNISTLIFLMLPFPMLAFAAFVLLAKHISNAPLPSALLLSPWFLPTFLSYTLLTAFLLIPMSKSGIRRQIQQDVKADKDALAVTGNLAAAESALDRLCADTPLSTEARAAMQLSSPSARKSAASTAQLTSAHVILRRAALQKTVQTL